MSREVRLDGVDSTEIVEDGMEVSGGVGAFGQRRFCTEFLGMVPVGQEFLALYRYCLE